MKLHLRPPHWFVTVGHGQVIGKVAASTIDVAYDLAVQKYGRGVIVQDTVWMPPYRGGFVRLVYLNKEST